MSGMHKTSGGLRLFQKKTKNSHMSFMLLSEHSTKLTPNVFVLVDDQCRDPLLVKIQKVKDWGMNTHAAPHTKTQGSLWKSGQRDKGQKLCVTARKLSCGCSGAVHRWTPSGCDSIHRT